MQRVLTVVRSGLVKVYRGFGVRTVVLFPVLAFCMTAFAMQSIMVRNQHQLVSLSTVDQKAAASHAAPIGPQAIKILNEGSHAAWVPTQDSWNVHDPSFWASRRNGGSKPSGVVWQGGSGLTRAEPRVQATPQRVSPPSVSSGKSKSSSKRDDDDDDDDSSSSSGSGKTYRTMCVRLCDGFYFPISFSTTKDNFDKDVATCESQCGGSTDARLFTYRNPGGGVDYMEDLDGRAYKKLPTANLFRTSYNAQCKCKAHPWEEASQNRHKSYALQDAVQKGDKSAARELGILKTKMQEDARIQLQQKQAAAKLKREAELKEQAEKSEKQNKRGNKTAKAEPKPAVVAREAGSHQAAMFRAHARFGNEDGPRSTADARAGAMQDPMATPPGGRASIVLLRYGSKPPQAISVPTAASRSQISIPAFREAEASQLPLKPAP